LGGAQSAGFICHPPIRLRKQRPHVGVLGIDAGRSLEILARSRQPVLLQLGQATAQ
jgi:hypothetical protein